MTDEQYPKDENLRLLLSTATDQDQWLRQQIKECKTFALVMGVLFALSAAWITADLSGAFSRFDEPECFSFSGEAIDQEELRKKFLAEGLIPCPQDNSDDSKITWTETRPVLLAISIVLLILSSLTLIRQLFLLRKNQGYLADNQALLKKYGR